MTYSPIGILGTTNTDVDFSFVVIFTLENTATVIEEILNCAVIYNNNYIQNIFSGNTVTFSGKVPLDVFDGYQLKYVDKGKSDKNQTPIVCGIKDMPDYKELYYISVDSRSSISVPITINLQIKKTTISLGSTGDTGTESSNGSTSTQSNLTEEIINEIINYELLVKQDYVYIKNWTQDYFKNRY